MKKIIVGLIEPIKIIGSKSVSTLALFDTGAKSTSVDIKLASKAKLGPVLRVIKIKSPSLKQETKRPIVRARIEIKGKQFDTEVNLQDRSHMTFPAIIGRNILTGNFLVDVEKNKELFKRKR